MGSNNVDSRSIHRSTHWRNQGYSSRLVEDITIGYNINDYDTDDSDSDYDEPQPKPSQTNANILKSRQNNPCDHYFWKCRGYPARPDNWRDELYRIGYYTDEDSDEETDEDEEAEYAAREAHRSRQLNPADDLFWKSRGYSGKPDNWQSELHRIGYYNN